MLTQVIGYVGVSGEQFGFADWLTTGSAIDKIIENLPDVCFAGVAGADLCLVVRHPRGRALC